MKEKNRKRKCEWRPYFRTLRGLRFRFWGGRGEQSMSIKSWACVLLKQMHMMGRGKWKKEMLALAKKEIKTKGKWVTKLKHEYLGKCATLNEGGEEGLFSGLDSSEKKGSKLGGADTGWLDS